MSKYDSIIIGSGINSLVVAAMLGKKGKRVLVLESRSQIGGLSSSMEFSSGYKCNMIYDSIKWIDPRVLKGLKLEYHGLKIIKPDIVRIALGNNGNHILFSRDQVKTAESISNFSSNVLLVVGLLHNSRNSASLLNKFGNSPNRLFKNSSDEIGFPLVSQNIV